MPEFTLYGAPTSTATSRVRLTLAEAGFTDYEFTIIDLKNGDHKKPEYLAHNPWGKAPVIVTNDGVTLYESRPICKFLAARYNIPLIPAAEDIIATALFDQAQSIEALHFSELVTSVSIEMMIKPRFGGTTDRSVVEDTRKKVKEFLDIVDTRILAGQEYMAGSSFSLVDIFYIPCVERLMACGFEELFMSRENVKAWWERCVARPAVSAFLDEEDLQGLRKQLRGRSECL